MHDNDKARTLCIKQVLERYSDEEHSLSLADINGYLQELYGFTCHRTTLTKDIETLTAHGMDIICVRSTQNRYFVGSRMFEIPELRLLTDAISSSKCLTEKKSEALIDKLTGFCSVHQAARLRERPTAPGTDKPANEQIYYIIDAIYDAMEQGCKIAFHYTDYLPDKTLVLRGDGEQYLLSPYACVWSGDYYYVIGWSDKRQDVTTFRVDRIAHTPTLCDEEAVPPPAGFDVHDYARAVFRMFKGESAEVTMLVDNDLMKNVIDRFGSDVHTVIADDEHFYLTTEVSLSPTFYGWVFSFGGKIRLLSPERAVNEYAAMLHEAVAHL